MAICEVDADLKDKLKKFRFRKAKNNAAIMMKVEKSTHAIVAEEEYEDCTLEELQDEFPVGLPRYLLYSCAYDHGDGRVSYPMCFIYVSPPGCKPEQQMMYAGSVKTLVEDAGFSKVFEVQNAEELTDEWLFEQLSLRR